MTFNPLEHPMSLMYPNRTAQSAWTEHIPLAMLLMDLLRPSLFVELGTHYGTSYCAFCQAVKHLGIDCRCFAVDTWAGDEHTGAYGQSVLDDLKAHHDIPYGNFSTLVQSTFDDAHPRFADGSIDLLHIDGYHTYEAVRHDFDRWLPKMSARGVVVFHDIAEHNGDFGVWKLWDELKARYPQHLAVYHGHGLGIVAVGESIPEGARELFALSGTQRSSLRTLMHELGRRIDDHEAAAYFKRVSEDQEEQLRTLKEQAAAEQRRQREALRQHYEDMLAVSRERITQVETQLQGAIWQINWFESSRGVRVVKLARASREVLRRKGVRGLTRHGVAWLLGVRGYGLRDLDADETSSASAQDKSRTPAVMFLSGCPGDAMRYRAQHQAEQLELAGCTCEFGSYGVVDLGDLLDRFQYFVFHRVPYGPDIEGFLEQAHQRGKLVFFDTDDLVFDPEASKHVAALEDMTEAARELYIDGLVRYRKTLLACDGVLVSTESLREEAGRLKEHVLVAPNVVSREMVRGADSALAVSGPYGSARQDGRIVITYFSGTPTHNRDFAEAADAVLWALDTYPQVRFLLVGHLQLDARFDRFGPRVECVPPQFWQHLPHIYTRVDINLAPLESNNRFTEAKSCLKWMEAALLGIPTIASPRRDFVRVIEDGKNGLLAETPEQWKAALRQLIESAELRREIGARAYDKIRAECTTTSQALALSDTLNQLIHVAKPETDTRPLTINWILRAPIAERGGGYRTIFRQADYLARQGHTVRVYVERIAHLEHMTDREIQAFIAEHFGPLHAEVIIGHERIAPADATIATNWPTADTVAKHAESRFKFYFIQDFEPEFYDPGDPLYREAERTYDLPLHPICIGAHLAQRIEAFSGRKASFIDFAVDQAVFHTTRAPEDRQGPPKVLFFARPGLKRRGYELGIEALQRVKAQRPDVEVLLFGSSDEEIGELPFTATNLGVLTHEQLAETLNSVHIQLSFSLSNISWMPFEAMACGAAVVEADVPSVRGMIPCEDACVLAKPNPESVAEAILRLVDDDDLRCRVAQTGATAMAQRTWENSAAQFEDILLRRCWRRAGASEALVSKRAAQAGVATDQRDLRDWQEQLGQLDQGEPGQTLARLKSDEPRPTREAAKDAAADDARVGYHRWYYDNNVWQHTTWAGVPAEKLPSDMWNYQEIISALQPGLIVEFGRNYGGSTMFFASMLQHIRRPAAVLSVDITDEHLYPQVREAAGVELMTTSSTAPEVYERIRALREQYPGPVFAILDSDHSKAHVLNELLCLRAVLLPGDYVIVEDGNINGHPVLPGWGEGPYEAIQEYVTRFPDDYQHDMAREEKFGSTFAVGGYLIRQEPQPVRSGDHRGALSARR